MQKRRLGDLAVGAVGLGCATMTPFYGEPDPDAAVATLMRAPELGIDLLDTSDAYGQGRNEELIARVLPGRRERYVIASKFGNMGRNPDGSAAGEGRPEYLRSACERSLARLRTDAIDLYYIHASIPRCRSKRRWVRWPIWCAPARCGTSAFAKLERRQSAAPMQPTG
jgi:aryl-alcohol dehydrogenase-like predicted oxidoreductase